MQRGLRQLATLVQENPDCCCVMCACAQAEHCHRRVIAEALSTQHFSGGLAICSIGPSAN